MAEEIVVKEPLTKEMIDVGRDMSLRLREKGFELASSFWFFDLESNRWRLVLASPIVDRDGPRKAYDIIENILQENWEMGIWLRDISAVSPNEPVVKALRSLGKIQLLDPHFYATAPRVDVGRRYTRSRLGDIFVEDAYIYLIE
jgi:hypothetical protein